MTPAEKRVQTLEKKLGKDWKRIVQKKATATLLAKDPEHFSKIGKVGGRNGTGHEFAHGKVDPKTANGKKKI